MGRPNRARGLGRALGLFLLLGFVLSCSQDRSKVLELEKDVKELKERVAQLENQLRLMEESRLEERVEAQEPPAATNEESKRPEVDEASILSAKKLIASPADFVGKEVRLKCEFDSLIEGWLDQTPIHFSSSKYLNFVAYVPLMPDGSGSAVLQHLFVKRDKGGLLSQLNRGDRIMIHGKVKSAHLGTPWMELSEIKRGWE